MLLCSINNTHTYIYIQAGDITTEAVGAVIRNLSGTVHCDQPNNIISAFAGFIELDSGEKLHYILDNVLLRGSVLARCDWCIGLVVYTGAETKVMKNNNKSPSKMSFIDKTVNWLLVIAIIIQVCWTAFQSPALLIAQLVS